MGSIRALNIWQMDTREYPFDDRTMIRLTEENLTDIVDKINEIIEVINDKYATTGENIKEDR